jgi:tRNA A58 N-methylase Trm61
MEMFRNATRMAQLLLKEHIKKGETVIDATCGTGQDTLFLAKMVGKEGKVLAFDIQDKALKITDHLLREEGCREQVTLIHDNHVNLEKYIQKGIAACMFNLGYLPGGDHAITTNAHDTVLAVNRAANNLNPGGVLTAVCYPGHPGGQEEYETLKDSLGSLTQKQYEVLDLQFINQVNNPPRLIVIVKSGQ